MSFQIFFYDFSFRFLRSLGRIGLAVGRPPSMASRRCSRAEVTSDPGERIAFIRTRPDRQDVRLVAGVLRLGEAWCAVRTRSHDSDAAVIQGEAVVPGLVEALAATLA